MSPSIERRTGIGEKQVKKHIIDLPNETGIYDAGELGMILVDMSRVIPNTSSRILILRGESLKGKSFRDTSEGVREVQLSWRGTGSVQLGPDTYLDVSVGKKLANNPKHARARAERKARNVRLW